MKLSDNISKTLHKIEDDVGQKDYARQEKEYDLRLQILEMENSKYKDLLENFLGKLENSARNLAGQDKQLNQFEAMHQCRLDEAIRKEEARIDQDKECLKKAELAKLQSFIAESINTIIQKIEIKIDKVEENQSIKIEHMKGSIHKFYILFAC